MAANKNIITVIKRFFNPFGVLYEENAPSSARTLRTSFIQKTIDTFSVFAGNLNIYKNAGHSLPNIGIFDYLTLCIPAVLTFLSIAALASDKPPLKVFGTAALVAFSTPRFIFAGMMTVLCLPFIAISHAITSMLAYQDKARIYEYTATSKDPQDQNTTENLYTLLHRTGLSIESISSVEVSYEDKDRPEQLTFALADDNKSSIRFFCDTSQAANRDFIDSMKLLNIGNNSIAKKINEAPLKLTAST